MLLDQIERHQVADAFVKIGRALEIGEQKGEAGDLEPLIDVERIGPVDVAERLVGEQPLGSEERLTIAEHVVHRLAGDVHPRHEPLVGAVL